MHFELKINGINPLLSVEVEAKFILKGGGYLILPERTCNVQGRIETMDFCSHLNPFVLSVVSVMAYKPQGAGQGFFFCLFSAHVFHVPNGQSYSAESYHITLMFFF